MYLKISENKIYLRVGFCSKLTPRYYEPFQILKRVGPVAYKLIIPPTMKEHDVFYISLLQIYIHDVNHIIDWNLIQIESKGELYPKPQWILNK